MTEYYHLVFFCSFRNLCEPTNGGFRAVGNGRVGVGNGDGPVTKGEYDVERQREPRCYCSKKVQWDIPDHCSDGSGEYCGDSWMHGSVNGSW